MMTTGVALLLLLISAISPNHAETTIGIHVMNMNDVTNSDPSNNDVHMSTSSQHGPAPETPATTHGMPMTNPSTEHNMPMGTSSQHTPAPETPATTHGMPMTNPSTEHNMPMSTSSQHTPEPETLATTHGMPMTNPSTEHNMPMSTSSQHTPEPETLATTHGMPMTNPSTEHNMPMSTSAQHTPEPETLATTHGMPMTNPSTEHNMPMSTSAQHTPEPETLATTHGMPMTNPSTEHNMPMSTSAQHTPEPETLATTHGMPMTNPSTEHNMPMSTSARDGHPTPTPLPTTPPPSTQNLFPDFSIRLVNGTNRCSGRVEVFHDGQWGTVCDDHWDMNNAEVVCRELDCGKAINALPYAYFGEGSGDIFLDDVMCSGNEPLLSHCIHAGFGVNNCDHYEDASVICSEIRVDGDDQCSGRVEVYHEGLWGTVCDDAWDMNAAEVACQELGCGNAVAAFSFSHSEQDSGPVWLDDVMCAGNESSVLQCKHSGLGSQNCDRNEDAAVFCSASSRVRLMDGKDICSGRVEVFHDGHWGSVCDDLDINAADVVCREMECGRALGAAGPAAFSQGSGPIMLGDVSCVGSESSLTECQHAGYGSHNCSRRRDASVICSKVRLVDGYAQCSGRVEVLHDDQWGTVCDDGWNITNADVVCREVGCGTALDGRGFVFRSASGPIWLDEVSCFGEESSLKECQHSGYGEHDCHHFEDVAVRCTGPVRLVSGADECAGAVELFHAGAWGTVCGNNWDINEAEVVCAQTNCGKALIALNLTRSGPDNEPIWLDDMMCSGDEASLTHCQHTGFGRHSCDDHGHAGVVCSASAHVRLQGGIDQCSGRVEVYHGEWGAVCDDHWGMNEAEVVCGQLGCGSALTNLSFTHDEEANRPDLLGEVVCSGNESSLFQCQHSGFGRRNCRDHEDAGVVCSASAHVRLVNGSDQCSGMVEVYNGEWGTVCNDRWDMNNAEVVCRQLGCGSAVRTTRFNRSGEDSGNTWFDDVLCSGNEYSLGYCQLIGSGSRGCSNGEVAGVTCTASSQVRLMDGEDICSGRVEVFHDGHWGSVCDELDMKATDVVCREMECGRALAAGHAAFGQGSGPTMLGDVSCVGNESSLTHCQHPGYGSHNCSHRRDAGVVCSKVRLVDGDGQCSGRVEVLHDGEWGTVCDDTWNITNADVVCREVGCGKALDILWSNFPGFAHGPIWLDDVMCSGHEPSLRECQHSDYGDHNCVHFEDVGVRCADEKIVVEPEDDQCPEIEDAFHKDESRTVCDDIWEVRDISLLVSRILSNFSAQVRLVNGSSQCSGRVEVYYDRQWGTVCNEDWDMNNAEVVCREVGCGRALGAAGHAHSGQGSPPPTLLDGVKCKGTESSLKQCQHSEFGEKSCPHHKVAAVVCTGMDPLFEMTHKYGAGF